MRAQLLRALQRLPQAAASNEGLQSFRAFSNSSLFSSDGSSLLSSLQGQKEDGIVGPRFAFKQLSQSPLSFAAHLSTLKEDESNVQQQSLAVKEVPKVPLALSALPARPTSQSLVAAQQRTAALAQAKAYGTAAAHDEDHHLDHAKFHPFHVLPPSPWPLLGGWGAGVTCLGMTAWFHGIPGGTQLMLFGLINNIATATAWWRDCIIESDMGMHTEIVKKNLISGVWLFILSEAMLFFGLLWSCIHLGMSPNVYVQMQWPPVGVIPVGWDKRALVMSAVLAASYYSANVAMVAQNPKTVMAALATTIGLGVMFLADQYIEYNELPFTITDSPYGSTFFLTTGFHGFHVLLGALWLAVSAKMYNRYKSVGVGMKGAVLYWHFVDIVWIAVYAIIYVGQF